MGHTGHMQRWAGSKASRQPHSSWVVTLVEFGQEVGAARLLALMEIAHYVGLLLPDVDRFLELHFALGRDATEADSDVVLSVMSTVRFLFFPSMRLQHRQKHTAINKYHLCLR